MVQITSSVFPCIGYMDSKPGGRQENQDYVGYLDTAFGLLVVVCDGMGGGPGGRTASTTAVRSVIDVLGEISPSDFSRKEALLYSISRANEALLEMQAKYVDLRGMGTTLTALLINEESAIVAHVGDSRVYKLGRYGKLFRTWDHSKVAIQVRQKELTEEQARLSAESNVITRVLGRRDRSEPEIVEIGFEKGDRFLLCTDGQWGAMPENELITLACGKGPLRLVSDRLINKADTIGRSNGGGHDNLSHAIIQVNIDSKCKVNMTRKARLMICIIGAVLLLSMLANMMLFSSYRKTGYLENQVSKLSEDINTLTSEKKHLNESIACVIRENQTAISNIKEGGKAYADKLTEENAALRRERDRLKAENSELKADKSKASVTKPSSQSTQIKAAASIKEQFKKVLTDWVKLSEPSQKAAAKKSAEYNAKAKQLAEKDRTIKKCYDKIKDIKDSQITSSNNKYVLTGVAILKIKEAIKEIN